LYPEHLTKGHPPENDLADPPLKVINLSRDDTIIAESVEWAGTGPLRKRGLLGREALNPTAGIYLTPCEWIHTFGMKFPIDVAFISPKGRILAIHHGLKPYRLSRIVLSAEGALELAAGRLRATGTQIGDQIQFLEMHQ